MGTFHHADVECYSGPITPAPWQNIDLTLQSDGITPTGMAAARQIAILRCAPLGVDPIAAFYVYTRPPYDAGGPYVWDTFVTPTRSHGAAQFRAFLTTSEAYIVVATDAAGTIDICSDIIAALRVHLYGWIDADIDNDVYMSGAPLDIFWPFGGVGTIQRAMFFSRWHCTNAAIDWTCRTSERPEEVTLTPSAGAVFGVETVIADGLNESAMFVSITDDTGMMEQRQRFAWPIGGQVSIELLHHVAEHDGYVHVNRIVGSAPLPSASWPTVDLSPFIGGRRRVLAFLKTKRVAPLAGPLSFGFRPGDATDEAIEDTVPAAPYGIGGVTIDDGDCGRVLVATDDQGCIEWRAGGPGDGAVFPGVMTLWLVGFIDSILMSLTRLWQTSLNTVDVEFSDAIRYLDPADPRDTMHLEAYTVTGPAAPARLVQAVTKVDDETIRLWFDGDLVPGEAYTIAFSGLYSAIGAALPPTSGSFVAFGPDRVPLPLVKQPAGRFDIRNPQAPSDAPQNEPLGTVVIDDSGDLGIETGRPYLRKRILRRLSTRKGTMFHEPAYGLELKQGGLYRPAELRALQLDVEAQVRQERDVVAARASVRELVPGVVYLSLKVRDNLGWFDLETEVGG